MTTTGANSPYSLAELRQASTHTKKLAEGLVRGMAKIEPLETALREQHGGTLPDPLPDGEYSFKLTAWLELLRRLEQAEAKERVIKAALVAQSQSQSQKVQVA